MEFNVINDYGVSADLDERLKIIREIQISSKNASAIKYIMTNLGSKFKIYQYNYDNKKDYDIFSWNSEDERTHTLTYNRHKGVQNAIVIMNDILNMLKIIESNIDIKVDVIIKMNNIETDLIRKIKDDIDFENSLTRIILSENELDKEGKKMSKFIKNEDGTFNIILSDTEKIEWENEAKLYCECAEEHNTIYVKDYMGVRHGWICNKCKKFTQIG